MPLASQQLSTPDLRQPRFQTALFSSLPFLLIYEINNWMESWHTVERDDFKFKVLKGKKKKEKKIGEKNRETRISRRRQKAVIYRWLIRVNGSPLLPKSLFCASSIHCMKKAHTLPVCGVFIAGWFRTDHVATIPPLRKAFYIPAKTMLRRKAIASLSLSLSRNQSYRKNHQTVKRCKWVSLSLSLSNLPPPPPRDLLSCYGTITRGKSPE